MEDGMIVDLFLSRSEAAIRETSEKYGSRLRKLAFGILNDGALAEECENDTYMAAWNAIPPHEPRTHLFAFLATLTRRISLDRLRSCSRIKRSAHVVELTAEMEQCLPSAQSVETLMDGRLLGGLISKFLRGQSQQRRQIFLRRYWYMDTVAQIAQSFQISESKVKTTLFRMRNDLRIFLKKEGYEI